MAISELFPHPSAVDGLLGMDFLGQFLVTLDRTAQQMWLASRQSVKPKATSDEADIAYTSLFAYCSRAHCVLT